MSGTYPTSPVPASVSRTSLTPTMISVAHSLKRQTRTRGSQQWSFSLSYPAQRRASVAPLEAFLAAQRGQYSTFIFVPPVYGSTSGSGAGTVTVNGAHSAGVSSIEISGLTGALKAGDFVKFAGHNKVYFLTADATTTLTIEPPLLAALSTGASVTYTDVPFTCALAADTFTAQLNPGNIVSGFDVQIVEVL